MNSGLITVSWAVPRAAEQRAEQHRGKLIICEINEARGSSGGIHLYLHITVTRAQTKEVLLWRILRQVLVLC